MIEKRMNEIPRITGIISNKRFPMYFNMLPPYMRNADGTKCTPRVLSSSGNLYTTIPSYNHMYNILTSDLHIRPLIP